MSAGQREERQVLPARVGPRPPVSDGLTRDAGSELVGELRDQVVVDPVLHGAEDDDGSGVAHCRTEPEQKVSNLLPVLHSRFLTFYQICLFVF